MEDHKVKKTIDSKSITIIILSFVLVIVTMLVIFLIILIQYDTKNSKKSEPKDIDEPMVTIAITEPPIETSNLVTTPVPETMNATEATNTTTAKPLTDTEMLDYTEFDTSLVVKVDDAGTLPLRDTPDRYESDTILQIPDGITVHVLGYKDTGTEIWFRVEYDGCNGWCRGGMLQPNQLSILYDDIYNKPGLEKWKSKFRVQEPTSRNYLGSAKFKGTLYFIPDFSSGVNEKFLTTRNVSIFATQGDWYYVEVYLNGDSFYAVGWVYKSQLSFD